MISRLLRALLWLASVLAAAAFVFLAVRGLAHPVAFHPIESAILDQAVRITQHEPLYLEASRSVAPAVMPGFPFAVAVLVQLFGAHLWELRLISLLATLAATGLVVAIARAETKSWTVAVASGGFMLMGYGLMAGRPPVARPETLMLALALGGYFALRSLKGIWGAVLATVLLAAACTTQLQALWFTAGALFYLAFEERARFITFAVGIQLLCGGGYLLLSQLLGPWFNFNAWDVPLHALQFDPVGLVRYVGDQLLGKLGVLTIAAVLSLALPTAPWRGPGGMWMCLGIGAVGAGLLATQSTHAGPHALIPSVVVLALLGPISMERITRHLAAWPGSSRLGGQGVVLAGLALQLIMFFSSVSPRLPASHTRPSPRHVIERDGGDTLKATYREDEPRSPAN